MPNRKETDEYILSLARLPAGWHFGGGSPPTKLNAGIMRNILNYASALGFETFEAFPGVDGEIQLAIHDGKRFYAVTIEADNKFTILYELNGEQVLFEEQATYYDVLSRLEEFSFQLCNTSELSILFKSPRSTASRAISPLKSHPMALGSHALPSNAPLPKADQSATTSPVSMESLLAAIRSSFGSSPTLLY